MTYEYYKGKNKKSQRNFRCFQGFCAIFCFSLAVISVCCLLSPSCGAKNRSSTLAEVRYYAICMGVYSDYDTALIQAANVRARGGAGYVLEDKGYRVLSAVYPVREDCESVVSKLKPTEERAECYTLRLKSVVLPKEANEKAAHECCDLYLATVRALYRESVALDTYTRDETACKLLLKGLLPASRYAHLEGDLVSVKFKAEFTALTNQLNQLALTSVSRYELSAELRYLQLQMLTDFDRLRKSIAA